MNEVIWDIVTKNTKAKALESNIPTKLLLLIGLFLFFGIIQAIDSIMENI
jgi:nitrogen fixation protein FixH